MKSLNIALVFIIFVHNIHCQKAKSYFVDANNDTTYVAAIMGNPTGFTRCSYQAIDGQNKKIPDNAIAIYNGKENSRYIIDQSIIKEQFLEIEINGPIYLLTGPKASYLQDSTTFIELTRGKKLSVIEYAKEIYSVKKFLTGKCSNIPESDVESMYDDERQLQEKTLFNLINKYNQCISPTYIQKTQSKILKNFIIDILAMGGNGSAALDFNGNGSTEYFTPCKFSSSNLPQGFVKLRVGIQGRVHGIFLTGAYGLSKFESSGSNNFYSGPVNDYYNEYDANINGRINQTQIGVEYRFRIIDKLYIFPTAGFNMVGVNIEEATSNYKRTWISVPDTYYSTSSSLNDENLRYHNERTWYYGGGLQFYLFSKLFITSEVVINKDTNIQMLDDGRLNLSNWTNYRIGIGYKLN